MRQNYASNILALDDQQLEDFVHDWMLHKTRDYHEVETWGGSGDRGRDVVGYETPSRHEGPWDNYQCKQLAIRLSEKAAFLELGKIFMHAANGEYTLPRKYVFVAPRGVVRNVKDLVAHPTKFKKACEDTWAEHCESNLIENTSVPITPDIIAMIHTFDFEQVFALDAAKMVKDADIKPALVDWFGDDPGAAPRGTVPYTPLKEEAPYLSQLVDAYSQRSGKAFADTKSVLADTNWGDHLRDQRTRYFDAAEFKRYYRDAVPREYLENLDDDIYHGVVDTYREPHIDVLAKVVSVLNKAADVHPAGVLSRYAHVRVKQGICHHFANEKKLPWKA